MLEKTIFSWGVKQKFNWDVPMRSFSGHRLAQIGTDGNFQLQSLFPCVPCEEIDRTTPKTLRKPVGLCSSTFSPWQNSGILMDLRGCARMFMDLPGFTFNIRFQ